MIKKIDETEKWFFKKIFLKNHDKPLTSLVKKKRGPK